MSMALTYVFIAMVFAYTAVAAIIDARLHRIPNYVTMPAALLGLAYHAIQGGLTGSLSGLLGGILFSLGGFAVGFLLLLLPWILGGGGMGDVKLLAALGAWLGWRLMLIAFAGSIFMAALIAVGVLIYHTCTRGMRFTQHRFIGQTTKQDHRGRPRRRVRLLPFAIPVAVSTWMVLAWQATSQDLTIW